MSIPGVPCSPQAPSVIENHRPPPEWPQEGKVSFRDYSTRYRDGLDLVLKRIAFDVPGGQKVGYNRNSTHEDALSMITNFTIHNITYIYCASSGGNCW